MYIGCLGSDTKEFLVHLFGGTIWKNSSVIRKEQLNKYGFYICDMTPVKVNEKC